MEDLVPVIILVLVIFWNVIAKIIGAVRKVLESGTSVTEPEVMPDNQLREEYYSPYKGRLTARQEVQDEGVFEIDDDDNLEPEAKPVINKVAVEKLPCNKLEPSEKSRRKLRQAIVWSEILAPPLALRRNGSDQ